MKDGRQFWILLKTFKLNRKDKILIFSVGGGTLAKSGTNIVQLNTQKDVRLKF